jgi:hypothetical protein
LPVAAPVLLFFVARRFPFNQQLLSLASIMATQVNGTDHHHTHRQSSDVDDPIMSDKPNLTQTISAITITPEQFEKVRAA